MVVMIRAGVPGCRMFDRGVFDGDRACGMHGARAGAVAFQSGAVTRQSSAVRTGRGAATAQTRAGT